MSRVRIVRKRPLVHVSDALCSAVSAAIVPTMRKQKKRAFITGITGQDGSYLAEHLISLGYDVWGLVRRTSLDPLARLRAIEHSPRLHLVYGNLTDALSVRRALKAARPHEVYNLAGQS